MKLFTRLKWLGATVGALAFTASSAQLCSGSGRYIDDVFSNVDTVSVVYSTTNQMMTIYQPQGDTASQRPVIIFAHGGSFIGGDRTEGTVTALAKNFAKRGYVTASIDYRLGGILDMTQAGTAYNVVIKAISDGKAAVRYFRQDAAGANTYRINPNLIYGGGNSAGAVLFVHLGYIDSVNEVTNNAIKTALNNNGGFEGNSGNPGYSSKINAIVNLAGGINDTSWISPGNVPMVSFHGDADAVVPYYCANAQNGMTPVTLCGTGAMQPRILHLGIDNDVLIFPGDGHVPWEGNATKFGQVDALTKTFLYRRLCADMQGGTPTNCTTARFRDEMFDIDSVEVEYTNVRSDKNKMDIFFPKNDTSSRRPLLLLAHGGGFTAGDKASDASVNYFKKAFARRGYVTASIDYRLAQLTDLVDSTKMLREVIWAISDAKAAMRYFSKDAATTNTYKIDTNFMFIGGNSAGAILSVHYAYIDDLNVLPSYVRDTMLANGGLEGNSGNPGYTSKVQAVVSLAGGINQTSWIAPTGVPIFMAHGDADRTVPYYHNQVYRLPPYNSFTLVTLYGSGSMDTALTARNIRHELKTFPGDDHCPWDTSATKMADIDTLARNFLYPMVCSQFPDAGPITGISEINGSYSLAIYPNPNSGTFNIRTDKFENGTVAEVFNQMGQLVNTTSLKNNITTLNLSNSAFGVYVVRVSTNGITKAISRVIVK
ncbi:MAG TPA: alpha/beta hydrolase fold domain-containing protein [Chitinophagales bacterium]|nr:alpha/beta hydrolase fold domain-containing protein [Chitinophagales bacterium]